jgi:hypothetical protein
LRQRLRELAELRRRFGYRRLHTMLEREGVTVTSSTFKGSIAKKACPYGNGADVAAIAVCAL